MSWAEAASNLGKSLPTLIFALVVFIITIILVLTGKVSFKTKNLQVGGQASQDLERQILRAQLDIAESATVDVIRQLPEDFANYRGYYIAEKVFDRVARWITLNHLSKDTLYKNMKKDEIHSICFSLMDKDKVVNPEFVAALDRSVDQLLDKLVDIRVYFEEKEKGKK